MSNFDSFPTVIFERSLIFLCGLGALGGEKKPQPLGKRLGSVDMPREPTPPRGRIAYKPPVEEVSWLAAAYFPRLPGQSPVAGAGIRLKVKGERNSAHPLAPYALRLAASCGFRSAYSCGAAGDLHPLPSPTVYLKADKNSGAISSEREPHPSSLLAGS